MEIQKIFSDMDGDERLYSVLMNEEELSLFSELEERLYRNMENKVQKNEWVKQQGLKNGAGPRYQASDNFRTIETPDYLRKSRAAAKFASKPQGRIKDLDLNSRINTRAGYIRTPGGEYSLTSSKVRPGMPFFKRKQPRDLEYNHPQLARTGGKGVFADLPGGSSKVVSNIVDTLTPCSRISMW